MSVARARHEQEAHFERLHRESADPWDVETSDYEREKLRDTLDALPDQTYGAALELGCSIGVMTEELARRCQRVTAMDLSLSAVMRARERCRDFPCTRIIHGRAPEDMPDDPMDLVTLCETGYYLSEGELRETLRRAADALAPGGVLLLAHNTEPIPDATMPGDAVHVLAAVEFGHAFERLASRRRERYRIDVFRRRDDGASAQR